MFCLWKKAVGCGIGLSMNRFFSISCGSVRLFSHSSYNLKPRVIISLGKLQTLQDTTVMGPEDTASPCCFSIRSGNEISSASILAIQVPLHSASPEFKASTSPVPALSTSLIRESLEHQSSAIRSDESSEPSLIKTVSISVNVCPAIDSSASLKYSSAFRNGSSTDTAGLVNLRDPQQPGAVPAEF